MTGTALDLETAIYTRLATDTSPDVGVSTVCAERIYWADNVPPDQHRPHVVLTLVNSTLNPTFESDPIDGELQVDVWAHKRWGRDFVRTLADRVYSRFHRERIAVAGFASLAFLAPNLGDLTAEGNDLRVMLRFRVFASGA